MSLLGKERKAKISDPEEPKLDHQVISIPTEKVSSQSSVELSTSLRTKRGFSQLDSERSVDGVKEKKPEQFTKIMGNSEVEEKV